MCLSTGSYVLVICKRKLSWCFLKEVPEVHASQTLPDGMGVAWIVSGGERKRGGGRVKGSLKMTSMCASSCNLDVSRPCLPTLQGGALRTGRGNLGNPVKWPHWKLGRSNRAGRPWGPAEEGMMWH